MENFKSSGIYSKQAHVDIPQNLLEEEHGRKGFFGRVSHLYHENSPVGWSSIEGDLKPRLLPTMFSWDRIDNNFFPFLANQDLTVNLGTLSKAHEHFLRNADCDELYFVHEGQGRVETSYGPLEFTKGDYLNIPRGTTYKFYPSSLCKFLLIESKSEFEQASRGILGPNALYDQGVIKTPEAAIGSEQNKSEYKVKVKRLGSITTITYPFNPLDVRGWKGSVYPFILSIYDICPVMSHRYHLPPSAHSTFIAHNFVICSFVERPLEDSKHKVLKVPFYHSNIDYDEVLFYHQGNFFSRDNIDAGSMTFHPQGIHHGPHPKAYANAADKTFTDEFAVMIDAKNPLIPTKHFIENENKDYYKSWM